MEYVQTVLVQIAAANIDEASRPGGLLAELDEHSRFLRQQPGFLDMRVTRSINAEGNVLLVIETRWRDDVSLVDYETREPSVSSIINRHQDIIVRDSLQVLDMEALRTETERPAEAAAAASERLGLPMMMPLGVLAFALLVIYGLSRIYLEMENEVATGLAAGIALGILVTAWFLASRPAIQAWQVAAIGVLAAAALTGGALFAIIDEDGGEASGGTPGATETPTPGGGGLAVELRDNFFVFEGEPAPTIPVAVGEQVTISLTNAGQSIHNMHIAGTDNEFGDPLCAAGGAEPCSDPDRLAAGDSGSVSFRFDEPGTFTFRCDFHPVEMTGEIEAQ
jgi:plastocyanin